MTNRAIIIVDGENLLFRFQSLIEEDGYKQEKEVIYERESIIWHPRLTTCLL